MKHLPATARDLVAALNAEYPARCIRPCETLAEAHRYAGARDVIDYLNSLQLRAENTDRILE